MKNLDFLAAKHGQQIGFAQPPVEESVLNDALDILHSQGIYALFLWLYEKPDMKDRGHLGAQIQALFRDDAAPVKVTGDIWVNNGDKNKALDTVREKFTGNVKMMFLAKDLIAHTLIYARHAAKARGAKEEQPHV